MQGYWVLEFTNLGLGGWKLEWGSSEDAIELGPFVKIS